MDIEKAEKNISNRWSRITTFVIISYLISEVFRFSISGFPINLQQIALLIVIFLSFTRVCRLGKSCKRLMISTGFYVALSGVSFLYCDDPTIGIIHFGSLAVNWLFLLAICRIGASGYTVQSVDVLFKWLIRMGVFEVCLGLLQLSFRKMFLVRRSVESFTFGGVMRTVGSFRDPTYFGFFLAVCFLWIYSKVCSEKRSRDKNYILLVLFFLGIVTTGSFTTYIGLFAGVGIVTFFRYNLLQIMRRSFSGALIVIFIFTLFFSLFSFQGYLDYSRRKGDKLIPENFERNLRVMHLVTGWNMFKERPLGGHGYGTFNVKSQNYVPRDYYITKVWWNKWRNRSRILLVSHVYFATLIGELGLLGVIAFAFMVWSIIKGLLVARHFIKKELRNKNGNPRMIELSLFFIGFSVAYFMRMLGYGFRLSDSFIIIFFVMGMLLADGRFGDGNSFSQRSSQAVYEDIAGCKPIVAGPR